jgi:hypothetical protein
MGGMAQRMEEKLRSLPIVGDAITSAHKKSIDEMNRAMYARALEPIGGDVPQTVGREGVKSVRDQLSAAYERLLPQVTFKADAPFMADMQALRTEEQAKQFDKHAKTFLEALLAGKGSINGADLQGPLSEVKRAARGLKPDQSYYNRELGTLVQGVDDAVRQGLARTNPDHAEELAAINKGFANYARIREAAGRVGSKEGVVSPAQLASVVQTMDKGVGRGRAAAGESFMQDLSDPAKSVLSQQYPDSGTAGRMLAGLLAGGGAAYMEPNALLAGGLASAPYLPGGRQLAAALMARRPDLAKPVGKAVMLGAPGAGAMAPALFGPQE